jgi:hypothetical protein
MLSVKSYAVNQTDADLEAERYQLLEVKEGLSTTTIYKVDTKTGATWILLTGKDPVFWPLRSFSHQVLDDAKLNKKAEVQDSFVPDPGQ